MNGIAYIVYCVIDIAYIDYCYDIEIAMKHIKNRYLQTIINQILYNLLKFTENLHCKSASLTKSPVTKLETGSGLQPDHWQWACLKIVPATKIIVCKQRIFYNPSTSIIKFMLTSFLVFSETRGTSNPSVPTFSSF